MVGIVGVALVGMGGWWISRSIRALPYFQVREVQVSGNAHISGPEILTRLDLRQPVGILHLDLEELSLKLAAHPWIRHASIERRPPLRLIVTVEERQPVARLAAGRSMYLVSGDGVILQQGAERADPPLPLLRAMWRAEVRVGERLSDGRLVGGLALIAGLRDAPVLGETRIEEVVVEPDGNYVLRPADSRTIVRLGPTEPRRQLARLDVALRHRGLRLEGLAYADLRFAGRVILKPTEKGG